MTDYHQLASSFYLFERLPDDWSCMDEKTYDAYLKDHAWEPFEYYDPYDIHEFIENLADTFHQVAKEARGS